MTPYGARYRVEYTSLSIPKARPEDLAEDTSLALPDRFFPFFFVGAQRKTGKSGLATRDYEDT